MTQQQTVHPVGASGGNMLPVGTTVTARVPASSANLGPGFDTFGVALGLYDDITVTVVEDGVHISVTGEGSDDVPTDTSHLVYKAIDAGLRAGGYGASGVSIQCTNRIPHSRGLGSSASAAVGGVVAANGLMNGALSDEQIVHITSEFEGHPDNAAASVLGGMVVSFVDSDDEQVRYKAVKTQVDPQIRFTVLIPQVKSSTSQTRGVLPAEVPHADASFNASRAALLILAVQQHPELLMTATQDRLHQNYRADALPEASQWVSRVRSAGIAAVVSGAGPTVLALHTGEFPSQLAQLAQQENIEVMTLEIADRASWS